MTIGCLNSNNESSDYHHMENFNHLNNSRNNEIENLKKIIQDLIKSNDEKVYS